MKKTYTLQWQNPSGKSWETIAENLTSARAVFIAIEKLQDMWKVPLERRNKFYSQLRIIEITEKGGKEINVAALMDSAK